MEQWQIEGLVRRAGAKLSEALWYYWPQDPQGIYEFSEANLRTALAQALGESGWYVFSEVPLNSAMAKSDDRRKRVDLVALHPADKTLLIVEFKAKVGEGMDSDVARMPRFNIPESCLHEGLRPCSDWTRYGLVVTSTWLDEKVKDWAVADDPADENIKKLAAAIPDESKATWGTVVLEDWSYREHPLPDHKWHYMMFVLFPLQD